MNEVGSKMDQKKKVKIASNDISVSVLPTMCFGTRVQGRWLALEVDLNDHLILGNHYSLSILSACLQP